jgi:polyisoprenoid-binding protein YceI
MKRHWKKIVGAVVLLIALVVGGSWFYAKVWNKPPAARSAEDLDAALDATIPATDPATGPATDPASSTAALQGAAGSWQVVSTSQVGYRVKESINGFDTEAVGRTNHVTGTITIDDNTVTAAEFTVDMDTFESDESRRDDAFRGRVMDVAQFPTSTFVLTQPIEFGAVPAEGERLTATATGDLTLHGTTNSVTFDLTADLKNGKVGVFAQIPIVFADYNVPNPSVATISTADNGVLECLLVFARP